MSRLFHRRGLRLYYFESCNAQAYIFGASSVQFWAWAVWGVDNFKAEGVEFSYQRARKNANSALDEAEAISA